MFESRIIQLAVLVVWLASVTWLTVTKLVPMAFPNQLPVHQIIGPGTDALPDRVLWRIDCDDQEIGTAEMTITRPRDGSPIVESVVRLNQFPVGQMLKQARGLWALLAQTTGVTSGSLTLDVEVHTRMHFGAFGQLVVFHTDVDLDGTTNVLRLRGTMMESDRLQIVVNVGTGLDDNQQLPSELLRKEIRIAPGALVVDGFAPHPRLGNLRLGQEWTMESLRPFSPRNPIRTIRARVDHREWIPWDREMESAFVVMLEDVSPQGLTTAQDSSVQLWVRSDGMVVRQRLTVAGVRFDFYRLPDRTSRQGPV